MDTRNGCVLAIGCLIFLHPCAAASGQSTLRDDFETIDPSWHDVGGDATYQVEVHQRTSREKHSGTSGEYVQINAGNGTFAHFGYDLEHAPVIAELTPSVWVRANRTGVQLLARVVLPHTTDPRTGKPVARLLPGTVYSRADRWQQLRLDDVPGALRKQLPALRLERQSVDPREAYIDRLLLNVYCGPGRTRVWIDELEVAGMVRSRRDETGAVVLNEGHFEEQARPKGIRPKVEVNGSVLLVDGHPMFPRIIEHRGEPLARLKELGFNTVRLFKPPTHELLAEAARAGLWLVSPPPRPARLDDESGPTVLAPFDEEYDPVLAWHMGEGLTGGDRDRIKRWVDAVLQADGDRVRLVVCDAAADVKFYSHVADCFSVVMFQRSLLGTSFELADYGKWLRERPNLALGDYPVWATIQTQPSPELIEQVALLSSGRAATPTIESEQIRLLVLAAIASKVRGLSFASRTPLDAPDPATRQRVLTLEAVNLELELIQPWIAAGNLLSTVPGVNTDGETPGVNMAVLQTPHTRLLVPVWATKSDQYVPDQLAGSDINFVVPGSPETYSAYEIAADGLTPLRRDKKKGGLHIKLTELGLSSLVLVTDEPAIAGLTRRLPGVGPRLAAIERELADFKLDEVVKVERDLARLSHRVDKSAEWLGDARNRLRSASQELAAHKHKESLVETQRAGRALRLLARAHWDHAIEVLGAPVACPLSMSFVTLPQYWFVAPELQAARHGPNLLPDGDMEHFHAMLRRGWSMPHFDQPYVRIKGEHSPVEPHAGRFSLRLSCSSADPEKPTEQVATAPIWVNTPPVAVQSGQWLCIRGWVRIPAPITGSRDGLLIIDSLGGEPLAERIRETTGWRAFTLYRVAPKTGYITLTIALTGVGEAWIDDLAIEPLTLRSAPLGVVSGK
jgi:hypothetical protein